MNKIVYLIKRYTYYKDNERLICNEQAVTNDIESYRNSLKLTYGYNKILLCYEERNSEDKDIIRLTTNNKCKIHVNLGIVK